MEERKKKVFFLSPTYKPIGYVLIIAGLIWLFVSQQAEIVIRLPVFALVSSFVSTKYFLIVQTNIADEIALITIIMGGIFAIFSREKHENERVDAIRYNSMFLALLINQIILLFSVFFFYGSAFITIVLANLVSLSLIYLIISRIRLHRLEQSNFLGR
ncbi:MAG TPA: hypothetical protein PLH30_07835 [Bacteroidales bacterium]|nr:hypothetical protein [Bacteroidales bacterium]